MILLVGHYEEADEIRANEYAECLKRNCEIACIEEIHLFIEDPERTPGFRLGRLGTLAGVQAPVRRENSGRSPKPGALQKVVDVQHGHRVFFDELFDYANRYLAGHICIVANSDIFFDESLKQLLDYDFSNKLLAISRWNVQADGTASILNEWSHGTQDVWIFRSPLVPFPCHWHLGLMECDRRLVYEAKEAGLELHNPCLSIKTRHLHLSQVHSYSVETTVVGPVDFIEGTELNGKRPGSKKHGSTNRVPMTKPLSYYESKRLELIDDIDVEGKRILDLGCGAGCMGKVLLERGALEVVGLEKVSRVATLARDRLSDVYQYDIELLPTIPYVDKYFDFIICADILEHLVHPGRMLQHFLRWLADDGKIICSIPNVRHESVLLPLLAEGKWHYVESGVLDSTHLRFFTLESINELLESLQLLVTEPIRSFKTEPSLQFVKLCAAVSDLGFDSEKFREQALTLQYFVTAQRAKMTPDSGLRAPASKERSGLQTPHFSQQK